MKRVSKKDGDSVSNHSSVDQDYLADERTPLIPNGGERMMMSYSSEEHFLTISQSAVNNDNSFEASCETLPIDDDSVLLMRSKFRDLESYFAPQYESLDYDVCENTLFLQEQTTLGPTRIKLTNIMRWVIVVIIGTFTAFTGNAIVMGVDILSHFKYSVLKKYFDSCHEPYCMLNAYAFWLIFNAIPVLIGSLLVTYVAPIAAGSGIPVIKCYLNGVKVPEVVRFSTYIVKFLGVILSVAGGLAVGKEGPMIHCGAIIAAGVSQGKSTTFRKDFKILQSFREDHEKRDFVSAGAAAGVAAAFGAPVGGVLFSLEEGASFWNQALTWRIFLCSMTSAFTLNLVMSAYQNHAGELSYSGLINFGKFDNLNYSFFEIPVYLIIGCIGGLTGAIYNQLNFKITVLRTQNWTSKWMKVLEAVVVAMMTASIGFLMIHFSGNLNRNHTHNNTELQVVNQLCNTCHNNSMRALWFQTPEESVRSMFHDPPDTWSPQALGTFAIVYFFVACYTYGLSVSSGLFIPTLLVGATWGRLVAVFCAFIFGPQPWICYGKFSVLGAAAQLGGVVRMTISLTVILMEATGNITLGFPVMITLMVSKWVGDFFNEGLYDIHIHWSKVPLLSWEPPVMSQRIYASQIMSRPVVTFKLVEKVGTIVDVLADTSFNGFPVVDMDDDSSPNSRHSYGRFRGLILRWQLIVLLQHKAFNETERYQDSTRLTMQELRDAYPRYPSIEQVHVSPRERSFTIDLRPYMNPSPYVVPHTASFPRIFRLFRALGLRHLVVVNDRNEVVGIVTRKTLAGREELIREESVKWHEHSRSTL